MKRRLSLITILFLACSFALASTGNKIAIPDDGWHLWLDKGAKWQDEPAFLSSEGILNKIPSRPPTRGWDVLGTIKPLTVTLPTTVEQHLWGVNGLRPYKNEYFYDSDDHAPRNGNYLGVSWWWRTVSIPKDFKAQQIILRIRAAKQRAEVYVNRHLVGYNFVAETAFECDVTKALRLGAPNTIAIRITNPGGRLDWGDWSTAKLGNIGFFGGHAFGGVDRGMTLEKRDPEGLKNPWVMNTTNPKTVTLRSEIQLSSPGAGRINAAILDPATGLTLAQGTESWSAKNNHGGTLPVMISFFVPNAKLWSPDHPKLYVMRAWLDRSPNDLREIPFGFRWIGPSGIGKTATLQLNGERIRVYSAISWGFWGLNGLWPTPALAEKEVRTAKSLGLNSLNFHRNIARAESLDAADRLGLLRYTEPGGGMTMFWDKVGTTNPMQVYMIEKIRRMVRDHRSHPSLTVYVVQNELDDDSYKHPLAEQVIRMIHQEDPSRPAILKSGLSPKGQMWMMPFDNKLYVDKGNGFSGWWDNHTVGYPEAWFDSNYQGPDNYVYRNKTAGEIVDYGEMGGSGTADNHALMLEQIEQLGGKSYDKIDHQEINAAYNHFLDSYGFRSAFPTTKGLFSAIGAKQYNYWENVIQCARLSDENDYLTISGWETTAIENHSGLVDALRNPHGDPAVLAAALRPVLPAIQLRRTSTTVGGSVVYDLYFLNETNHPISGSLGVSIISPDGKAKSLGSYKVPKYRTGVFVYPIAAGHVTPALSHPGVYKLRFSLGRNAQTKAIYVVDLPKVKQTSIGFVGQDQNAIGDLKSVGQTGQAYDSTHPYSVIWASADPVGLLNHWDAPVSGTPDPALFKFQRYGKADGMSFRIGGLPNGSARVTLGMAEQYFEHPNSRIFDLKINGLRVLQDFDLFQVAGGKNKALTKTFDVVITDGQVTVTPGNVKLDNLCLNTIRVDTGATTVAYYFGDKPYTGTDGTIWKPYQDSSHLTKDVFDKVRNGTTLIISTDHENSLKELASQVAAEAGFKFKGLVGKSRAPWMGSWYMVRQHPLYDGLPTNTVMKGEYQTGLGSADGLIVSGSNIEIVTAYSRDHSREIGAGDLIVRLGKGKVIIHCVPRMNDVFQRRWVANVIRYATSHK